MVGRRGREDADRPRPAGEVEPRSAVHRADRAPPRSAMSPAAATSQADSPPCWMKASNRPLATYASASAAEPIDREIRIWLRTSRARDVAARPDSAIEITKSDSLSLSEVAIGRPSSSAGPVARGRERLVPGRDPR